MQAQPELAALGVRDPGVLDPYLERRRYARGERIMAQGSAGTECYLITGGEVRLEVERPDFDSDVIALVLSDGGLGRLCRDDPPTGVAVLRALGRDAAAKAREQRRHLEEYE